MSKEVIKWANELKAKEIIDILNERDFDARYAATPEEARKMVNELIPDGSTICVGGSVTLNETGIMDDIRSDRYKFIDRFNTPSFETMLDKYREGYTADVMVSSTNAITKEGQLVNIDCAGNRTGQIAFGPKKVIIVAGVNKIVDTLEDGLKRAKSVAPMNARRITHKTPCATDDNCSCTDCRSNARVCNVIGIVDGCHYFPKRITVIVVPEVLGY